MLILANLLIEIVAETYGEVTEKKYLYVFKERVDLICDWQADLIVLEFIKDFVLLLLRPVHWCFKKSKLKHLNLF